MSREDVEAIHLAALDLVHRWRVDPFLEDEPDEPVDPVGRGGIPIIFAKHPEALTSRVLSDARNAWGKKALQIHTDLAEVSEVLRQAHAELMRHDRDGKGSVISLLERALDLEYLNTGDCEALGEVFEKAEADAEAVSLFADENQTGGNQT
jgi:hypothetical protein